MNYEELTGNANNSNAMRNVVPAAPMHSVYEARDGFRHTCQEAGLDYEAHDFIDYYVRFTKPEFLL